MNVYENVSLGLPVNNLSNNLYANYLYILNGKKEIYNSIENA